MDVIFCTLATRSHLAHARVLATSLARVKQDARLHVLVVDAGQDEVPAAVPMAERLTLQDLDLHDRAAFCFQYTAFELCNALKAPLLLELRRRYPATPIVYLDADIYCVGSLEPLLTALSGTSLLLTPHTSVDFPAEIPTLKTSVLLCAGAFNAGVLGIGCGPEADGFLAWWAAKLRHDCLRAIDEGLFVDQKFLDLVPCLFPGVSILRDDGVNVAWFNLHARLVSRQGDTWFANERPLALFHFTMFDGLAGTFDPSIQPDPLAKQPVLRGLAECYRQDLAAAGHEQLGRCSYGFGAFADGTPVLGETRRAFRSAWLQGSPVDDPFHSAEWMAWQQDFVLRSKRAERVRAWIGFAGRIRRTLRRYGV